MTIRNPQPGDSPTLYVEFPVCWTGRRKTTVGTGTPKTTTYGYVGLTDQAINEEQPDSGGTPKAVASYTYGPSGERISQTKTPLAGGAAETSYYGLNPHTDVETLTSETGAARSTYRYTGYGRNDATGFTGKDKASATGGPEVEPYNPYRFNSKRWDPATAGYDMGFRDYSPGLNRFLTRDMYAGALADLKLGTDPWNTNCYAFARGNPITGIELDGHYAILENGERVSSEMPTIAPPGPESKPSGLTDVALDKDAPNRQPVAPHPDRFTEMAQCNGGPGCVMPKGYTGKYGPYVHPGSAWELLWLVNFIPGGAIPARVGTAVKSAVTASRAAKAATTTTKVGMAAKAVPDPAPVLKPSGVPDRTSAVYISVRQPDGTIATVGSRPGGVHAEDVAQGLAPGSPMSRPSAGGDSTSGELTWQPISVCVQCQPKYPPSLFPGGTGADPLGAWGQ